MLGHTANQNIWWIDYSFFTNLMGDVGSYLAIALQICAGIALLLWAILPDAAPWRRNTTAVLIVMLDLLAWQNAFTYWSLLASGRLYAGSPVPLSAFIAIALAWLAAVIFRAKGIPRTCGRDIGLFALGLCVAAFLFPLLQIGFFGTTDYRRPADAAVVLGAQVHEDGTLSVALAERMDVAIGLYQDGSVPTLIVSGGTGHEGVNEAYAMRDYAVAAGVPSADVIVDPDGVTTEATADDTIAIMREHDMGRVIVVSSFYHMPRIKMMYLAQDVDVLTVPAFGDPRNDGTFKAIWREIPGWWLYWFKDTLIA